MATKSGVRERILDAAVALLQDAGVKRLAQPQVARAAKVPQGHLTYYFPKKADMLMGVAARFLEMLARDAVADAPSPGEQLAKLAAVMTRLVKDRARTRMLLGLLVEADSEEELRLAMQNGAAFVRGSLATAFQLPQDGPEAHLALALFWGLGLQQFLMGEARTAKETEELVNRAIRMIQQSAQG
ncbi:MAG: TetR/AcrR family transcriptional regulator [Myxococcales bacterium]|nr:TetR/AcrR family transcriptional regulator [Polyangiaceae bacterium]MDW8249082.1 TetR/AcrR family transcriptional regulator [Myxococcales bacterium]